ncbi:MAG: hypothetical protein GY943_28665 [Chloroflexi bacterium]|nr:hypothetical protein [Chloroflexota bacterium]
MRLEISFSRKKIIFTLVLITALLTIANLIHQLSWFYWEQDFYYFSWRLDVGGDKTIPGWFSSTLLLFCAGLIYVTALVEAKNKSRFTRHWKGLAFVFLFLSLDETAAIHEWSGSFLSLSGFGGFLLYSWVIFGLIFVTVFVFAYLRFFWHLPRSTQIGFFIAGAMFVGGALGLEMLNARIEFQVGAESLLYQAMTGLEELLEMSGLIVLVNSVWRYLEQQVAGFQVNLSIPNQVESAAHAQHKEATTTAVNQFEEITA